LICVRLFEHAGSVRDISVFCLRALPLVRTRAVAFGQSYSPYTYLDIDKSGLQ